MHIAHQTKINELLVAALLAQSAITIAMDGYDS
jgi:hypothetical protein